MSSSLRNNQALYIGLAVTTAALVASYLYLSKQQQDAAITEGSGGKPETKASSKDAASRSKSPVRTRKDATETTTPLVSNISGRGKVTSPQTDKEVHSKIEELDKIGKKLFKEKKVKRSDGVDLILVKSDGCFW